MDAGLIIVWMPGAGLVLHRIWLAWRHWRRIKQEAVWIDILDAGEVLPPLTQKQAVGLLIAFQAHVADRGHH